MVRRRIVSMVCLGGLLACQKVEPLPIDAEPGDIVVIGVFLPDQTRPSRVRSFIAESEIAPELVASEERLVVGVIDQSQLIGPDGVSLEADERAALVATLVDQVGDPPAECGRCSRPSPGAPFIISEGERCALPESVELTSLRRNASEGDIAAMRQDVRINWPGKCGCEPHVSLREGSDVGYRYLPTRTDPHPLPFSAQADDGSTLLASSIAMVHVAPDGTRTDMIVDSAVDPCETRRATPFAGSILAAAGLTEGRFVVASLPGSAIEGRTEYRILGPDMSVVAGPAVITGAEDFRPEAIIPIENSSFFFIGGFRLAGLFENQPELHLCRPGPDDGSLDCEPSMSFAGVALETETFDARLTDQNVLLAATRVGTVHYGVPTGEPRRWDLSADTLDTVGIYSHLGLLGRRAFLCAESPFEVTVLTATISRAGLSAGAQPEWTSAGNFTPPCRGFVVEGDTIHLAHAFGRATFDRNGQVIDRAQSLAQTLGVSEPVLEHRDFGARGQLVRTLSGAWARSSSTTSTFAPLYGPSAGDETQATSAIVARENEFWAFRRGEVVSRIRQAGVAPSSLTLQGFGPLDVVVAGTATERGSVVVAGYTSSPQSELRWQMSWLREIDENGVSTTLAEVRNSKFHDMAQVADGVYVVIGSDNRIFRFADGSCDDVRIEWDDPTTVEVEGLPPGTCSERSLFVPGLEAPGVLRVVDGQDGVAWVGGCGSAILRVSPFGPDPVAIRVAFARGDEALLENWEGRVLHFTALRGVCADNVVLAGPEQRTGLGVIAPLVEVVPADHPLLDPVMLRGYSGNASISIPRALQVGAPIDIVGPGPNLTIAWGRGLEVPGIAHRFSSFRRDDFQASFSSIAANTNNDLLIGADAGRLVYGKRCE